MTAPTAWTVDATAAQLVDVLRALVESHAWLIDAMSDHPNPDEAVLDAAELVRQRAVAILRGMP